jgi:anti-sigma factor RsiW
MNENITHERCSELMRPYVGGELGAADVAAVERHLASCDDCRQELSGMRALLDYEYDGLSGTELVRLERAISAAMRADRERAATVIPLERRAEARRSFAGVALGVAAAVAIVAFAIVSVSGDGPGDGDAGTTAAAPEAGGDAGGGGAVEGPRPTFGAGVASKAAFAEERVEDQEQTNFRSTLATSGKVTQRDLERLGKSRRFQRFAAAYDAEDATALQDRFVGLLARGAGDDAGTVTLCTRNTLEASTGPALPVMGTFARFEDKRALVLGFVYTAQTEGALNRFTLWVWPRGSCDSPLRSASGTVP